jgi:hypothetical protein
VDGFDDIPILAQNLSQCRHLYLQIGFLYYRVRPDAAYDLIFRDDGAGRPDQHHQKIEGATAEFDRLPIDEQLAGARQHATLSKPNDRVAASVHLVLPRAPPIQVMHRLVRGSSRDQLLLHDASPPSDLIVRR